MPIPALITGAAGLLGNIVGASSQSSTNANNMAIAQMNNEFNERMMEKQHGYNIELWEKNNAYNDPSAVVERLKKAGINPAAALGNMNYGSQAANGPSMASASGNPNMQSFRPDTSAVQMAAQMIYDKRLQDAQIQNLAQDTASKEIANRTAYQEAMARLAKMRAETSSTKTREFIDKEMLGLQRRQMSADYELAIKKQREQDLLNEGIRLENFAKEINNQNLPSFLKLQLSQMSADLAYRRSVTKMTDKQFEHEVEKMIETQVRRSGAEIDNEIKKSTKNAIINASKYNDEYNRRTLDARVESTIAKSYGEDEQRDWKFQRSFRMRAVRRKYGEYH